MKKNLITMAFTAAAIISSVSAFATGGQVNFQGEIIDTGCDVVNTPSTPLIVNLGSVAKSEFGASGDTSAATGITLKLTNCPATASTAKIKFDGAALNGDNSVLKLTQVSGVATGVGIQISDVADVLPLFQDSTAYTLQSGSVENDLNFTARYISVSDTVTAGPANSSANFSVTYN